MRGNLGSLSYVKGSNPGGRPLVHVTVTLAQNGLYFQPRPNNPEREQRRLPRRQAGSASPTPR